jgi:AraC-like DNA-binding protein
MTDSTAFTAVRLPAPRLRPFITKYAAFHVTGLQPGFHLGLPSSTIHLIISLGQPIEILQMPNPAQQCATFTALVTGLNSAPAMVRRNADAFGLHIFIRPLGSRAILGATSRAISSLVLNLSDIWGHHATRLLDMLSSARTWNERFTLLDQAFMAKLTPVAPHEEIRWAWERLTAVHGSASIQRLAEHTGYSRRHFCELFHESIGVSPKLAARMLRFERACSFIAEDQLSLAHIAIECGYYDQAHLTREWYSFARCSPKAWFSREFPFLQDYEFGVHDNWLHDNEA